jgi:flagellar biosynthetic protein FliQ
MNEELIITVAQQTMITVLTLAGPLLLAGLVIGLTVSILQSVTSIHEQSLSMIPKMIAVMVTLLLLMPWLLRVMKAFVIPLLDNLESFVS